MSKEFEEIVLKKLDNTDRLIQDVVLKKLDDTDRTMQKFALKLDNTDKTMQEFATKLDNTNRIIQDEVLKRIDNTEKELKDTKETLNNLSLNFARFEHEIIKKVDTLFDAYSTTEAAIVSLNTKYFNHDTRISDLEDKLASA